MKILENKVALITGAGRPGGLGQAIARRFAEEGATIILTDIGKPSGLHLPKDAIGTADDLRSTAATLSAQTSARVVTMTCDVRSEEEIKQCVADTAEQFGQLDIVVNNAGIGHIMTSVLDCTAEEWDLVLSVNLRGAFLFTKYGAMQMIAQNPKNGGRGGRIINISSQAGKSGIPNMVAYTSSKHGMIGLTRAAAIDLGRHGITVNAVCPNHVTTQLGAVQNSKRSQINGVTVEQVLATRAATNPMRRVGLPEDTANACFFLASENASYINGEAVNVSGGEEMH